MHMHYIHTHTREQHIALRIKWTCERNRRGKKRKSFNKIVEFFFSSWNEKRWWWIYSRRWWLLLWSSWVIEKHHWLLVDAISLSIRCLFAVLVAEVICTACTETLNGNGIDDHHIYYIECWTNKCVYTSIFTGRIGSHRYKITVFWCDFVIDCRFFQSFANYQWVWRNQHNINVTFFLSNRVHQTQSDILCESLRSVVVSECFTSSSTSFISRMADG